MAEIAEFAPAKVNLCLHVTGQRADGYHLLDSLVVFADVGDRVVLNDKGPEGRSIHGPQAAALSPDADNLCSRAARAMGAQGIAISLEKHLPVSSGIGGGSADAAAVLRGLQGLGYPAPSARAMLGLGADVPVCLQGRAVRMRGVGEEITPFALPEGWLVLANPGVAVSTPAVFGALGCKENPALPERLARFADLAELAAFLKLTRNDLEPAAIALVPQIAALLAGLRATQGCLLARMSGSGATCCGLYASQTQAEAALAALRADPRVPMTWGAAARLRP